MLKEDRAFGRAHYIQNLNEQKKNKKHLQKLARSAVAIVELQKERSGQILCVVCTAAVSNILCADTKRPNRVAIEGGDAFAIKRSGRVCAQHGC